MSFNELRKQLRIDIWNLIENIEIREKTMSDFIFLVFQIFLESSGFTMKEVLDYASKMKNIYDEILQESTQLAMKGEPIKALDHAKHKSYDELTKIIENIKNNSEFYANRVNDRTANKLS